MTVQARSDIDVDLSPGQPVSFEVGGTTHVGVVVRLNRRTVLVETPDGRWRVTPSRLMTGDGRPVVDGVDHDVLPGISKDDVVELMGVDGMWLVVKTHASSYHVIGGTPPVIRLRVPSLVVTLAPARHPAAVELQIAIDTERAGWRIGDRVRSRESAPTGDFTSGVIDGFATERAQVRDASGQRWSVPYCDLDPGSKRSGDVKRVRRVHGFANGLLDQNADRVADWRFALDDGQRRAGACFPSRKLVTVSRQFAFEAPWDEVRDTVIHEVAHALTPGKGHGPAWREAARALGGSASRTHSVPFGAGRRGT